MFKSKEPPGATERGPGEKETGPQTAPERETSSGQHSIIPADLEITGNLVSHGDIHVEGVIHGDITCRTLTLTANLLSKARSRLRVCVFPALSTARSRRKRYS